jgi:exodeoxyribonuclease VII large subunit
MSGPTRELFAGAAAPPLTVTQVNQRARQLLERQFARVTVVGEVSNLRVVGGHSYLSLKDAQSQLPAVLFAREASRLKLRLADGMEVVGIGRLTIYSPRGTYQIVLESVERRGAGALQAAFEELKVRLAAEGLFAAERKRPLPRLPGRVAVVTSPTGAVIRDIIHVAVRRFPGAQILVVPTRVQGGEAAPMVAAAIAAAARLPVELAADVIIVARGGGSLEDLWCFNDERVARAIAASPVPVVSGVGHETDFTIADFVADVRAPTPSAAAELVFPRRDELVAELSRRVDRAARGLGRDLAGHRHRLRAALAQLGDGRALVAEQTQRLDLAAMSVTRAVEKSLAAKRRTLDHLRAELAAGHPAVHVREVRGRLATLTARLTLLGHGCLRRERSRLATLTARLQALSPLEVLERGYSILLDAEGRAVREVSQVRAGESVAVRLWRGRLRARVESIEP